LEGSVFEHGSPFIERMVQVLDADGNGEIDFREFGRNSALYCSAVSHIVYIAMGLSLFCRGTIDELVDCTTFAPYSQVTCRS